MRILEQLPKVSQIILGGGVAANSSLQKSSSLVISTTLPLALAAFKINGPGASRKPMSRKAKQLIENSFHIQAAITGQRFASSQISIKQHLRRDS
jgi:hypothetical protein